MINLICLKEFIQNKKLRFHKYNHAHSYSIDISDTKCITVDIYVCMYCRKIKLNYSIKEKYSDNKIILNINLLKNSPRILMGFGNGMSERSYLDLHHKDFDNNTYLVVFPFSKLFSINTSFVRGLFSASITRMGVKKFEEKYYFEQDESAASYSLNSALSQIKERYKGEN